MNNTLFNPNRIDIPDYLVLVPQFWDKKYFQELKEQANVCFDLISTDILFFENYTVAVGFLGYPHLLTLLEFFTNVREKEVFFLGTAGSLNPDIHQSIPLNVTEIHSTEILDHFSDCTSYPLKSFEPGHFRKARGVTVDIIQRETAPWLQKQIQRGLDFVEMELFPLRAYLEKPFSAVVVTTDLLKETGIEVFKDKKQLQKEFIHAYETIVASIPKLQKN